MNPKEKRNKKKWKIKYFKLFYFQRYKLHL